ncbi:MAG: LPS assembly lipoprotein LptE [Burkholderiales bacterium]
MQRRNLIGAGLLSLSLAGCGFKLRASQVFAFQTIAVTPESGSAIATDLARYLADLVVPLAPTPGKPAPEVIFDVLQELRDKIIVGVNASGQVREYQLRIRIKFRLRTPQGRELIAPTELTQQRDVSYSETAALAKEAEEVLLYRDMQSDLVQQLLRRLAAIKQIA